MRECYPLLPECESTFLPFVSLAKSKQTEVTSDVAAENQVLRCQLLTLKYQKLLRTAVVQRRVQVQV